MASIAVTLSAPRNDPTTAAKKASPILWIENPGPFGGGVPRAAGTAMNHWNVVAKVKNIMIEVNETTGCVTNMMIGCKVLI